MPEIAFTGSIPEAYDAGLGEILFEPYAIDVANRLKGTGQNWLEVAAGTGRLTRHLAAALPDSGTLVATDLHEGMLAVARKKIQDRRVSFQQADALDLPFPENSFDVVVAQFGIMFYPDKTKGQREARRVLRPGGTYLFSAWGPHSQNPWAAEMQRFVSERFPVDTPGFYHIPFSFHDPAEIERVTREGGFEHVRIDRVEKPLRAESAERLAYGAVLGNPLLTEIQARGADPDELVREVTERFASRFGRQPVESTQAAYVATAS